MARSNISGGAGSGPRVDRQVEEVDREGGHDDGDRADEDDSEHDRQIDVQDREHGLAAEAGPGEDGLDDDGAAEERAEVDAGVGHDRQERVAQAVLDDDGEWADTLGARGANVVLAEDVEEPG